MTENPDTARIEGNVLWFNGTFGLVVGEDGEEYFLHASQVRRGRKCLDAASSSSPVRISFEPGPAAGPKQRPKAIGARIVEKD